MAEQQPAAGSKDTISSTHTDYGTTTLNASKENVAAVDDEALRLRFSTHTSPTSVASTGKQQFGYQSLPSEPLRKNFPRHTQNSFILLPSTRRHQNHQQKMTVDTMPNSETRQVLQRVEYFLNVVNQMCIGFVTIYMSWLCLRNGLAGTALHAWLVTIGYCFLMAEGIMCHYSNNVLTFSYKRSTKTTLHWVLQALGGGMGVAGILVKIIQKGLRLQSTHSKLGFACLILCLASMLSGLSAFFSMRVKKLLNPLLNKTFHNLLGVGTFVTAMLAQYYGYSTGYFSRNSDKDFRTLIGVVTLVLLVLSSLGPLKALYHKTRNIIRHFK